MLPTIIVPLVARECYPLIIGGTVEGAVGDIRNFTAAHLPCEYSNASRCGWFKLEFNDYLKHTLRIEHPAPPYVAR